MRATCPQRFRGGENKFFYAFFMGTRPQTLTGLADSPVGLAAFMIDHDWKSLALISRSFAGVKEGLTRDDVLDNISHFWFTNSGVSASRLYWENKLGISFFDVKGVKSRLPSASSRMSSTKHRGAGRRRRIPSSSTTTSSQGRALRGGTAEAPRGRTSHGVQITSRRQCDALIRNCLPVLAAHSARQASTGRTGKRKCVLGGNRETRSASTKNPQ